MALALYMVVAIALLLLSHRYICPVSRIAAAVLFLLPFVFIGYALVTSREPYFPQEARGFVQRITASSSLTQTRASACLAVARSARVLRWGDAV